MSRELVGRDGPKLPVAQRRICVICLEPFFGLGRFCDDYPCKDLAKKHGSDVEAMRTGFEKWLSGRVKAIDVIAPKITIKASPCCVHCNRKMGPYGCQRHQRSSVPAARAFAVLAPARRVVSRETPPARDPIRCVRLHVATEEEINAVFRPLKQIPPDCLQCENYRPERKDCKVLEKLRTDCPFRRPV